MTVPMRCHLVSFTDYASILRLLFGICPHVMMAIGSRYDVSQADRELGNWHCTGAEASDYKCQSLRGGDIESTQSIFPWSH